jgi:hypothetical protein
MAMTPYADQLIGQPAGKIPAKLDDCLSRAKLEMATITGTGPQNVAFPAFDPVVCFPALVGATDLLPDDWTLSATFDALNNQVVVDAPAVGIWRVLLLYQKHTAD